MRIAISDCDLGIRGRNLKWEYFSGKVVWVVGAGGGIGEQLCYQLSHVGARIILSDLPKRIDHLDNIRNQFASPQSARIVGIDLMNAKSFKSVVEEASGAFGHIDILILAAGIGQLANFKHISQDVDLKVMEVNYGGPRELIRMVLQGMSQRKSGHIVAISSFSGKVGTSFNTSYTASKFALFGMLEGLKYELYKDNIHVTVVCPGAVDTELFDNLLMKDGVTVRETPGAETLLDPVKWVVMSPLRCAELILIAVSNQLEEVWIGKQPFLGFVYLRQYFPSIYGFISKYLDVVGRMGKPLEELENQ